MTLAATTPDPQSARARFRERTCAIARSPDDAALHLARLHAALQLPGAEPVQGALADLFATMPLTDPSLRRNALQMAEARLNPHVAKAFVRHTQGHALPRITSLATRWSVWAQPSAEVPARVRRASPDDSHRLARQVVEALYDGEPTDAARIEQDFLDHCISCQDKLAFMLATRDLRRAEIVVDERWTRVAAWLQQRDAFGEHQTETDAVVHDTTHTLAG